jgi:hypothetical protein
MTVQGILGSAAIAVVAIATQASASQVSIESISGTWTSALPVGTAGFSGLNTNSISWGVAGSTGKQSGYDFDAAAPLPMMASPDTDFVLGQFTHHNNPIKAYPTYPSITSAVLDVVFDIKIGSQTRSVMSQFTFTHNETPNTANPCANGGTTTNDPLNAWGCADSVTVNLNQGASETFKVDGKSYMFNISGFEYGLNNSVLGTFWTKEKMANHANLVASYSVVPSVPLPAAGWMLIAGIGGIAAMRKRKKSAE